jgi:hypothetical protein
MGASPRDRPSRRRPGRLPGGAEEGDGRYTLAVSVNDAVVWKTEAIGASPGGAILVPRKLLKLGDRNRLSFDIEGRGTFRYAATLTGFARDFAPDQARAGRVATIDDRAYQAPDPEVDGRVVPAGFSSVVDAAPFINKITSLAEGGTSRVLLSATVTPPPGGSGPP